MQVIIWLPPGNASEILQIRNISPLKYLHHEVRIGGLYTMCGQVQNGVTEVTAAAIERPDGGTLRMMTRSSCYALI